MQNFNSKIIDEIIKQSPGNVRPANVLTEIFNMSKETAYRRINNRISFSIEEVVTIAKYFNFSIDAVLDLESENHYLITDNVNVERQPADIYSDLLGNDIELMEKLLASARVNITATMNRIPFRFLPYQSLFKLDYCHFLYSQGKVSLISAKYDNIEIPPAINNLYRKTGSYFNRLNNITCIVNGTLFSDIIKKIQYYYRLKFISGEDLKNLQADLLNLLEKYEKLLHEGKNSAGSNYTFYYSFFNLESNMIFLEYDKNTMLQFWIYPESPITIKNNRQISDVQKRWIDSKIRSSMLISKTSDVYQIDILRNIYQQILDLPKESKNIYELF